jgi:intracellular sulfur oxidation DsrE/DsrF family protein
MPEYRVVFHLDVGRKSVEVVPAGITVLVKRQAQGWAYVRP